MAKTKTKRWRFAKDNDGHVYLIPAELNDKFDTLLESDEDAFIDAFEQYMTGTGEGNFTFADPKEDD